MELTGDLVTDVHEYYRLCESGHKELKAIRQRGKGPSFGMQYGAYPPKIAASIKCSLEEAETIFHRYHNDLYPGVTKFREEVVTPAVTQHGITHMGLGCYLRTNNPKKDIRTLVNSNSQFWSCLTLLTINKMHHHIDEEGRQDDIRCISTIYDSIYYLVKDTPEDIKWLNDTIVPIMTADFIEGQTVPNTAIGEIGLDWADMTQIPNNATTKEITDVLNSL